MNTDNNKNTDNDSYDEAFLASINSTQDSYSTTDNKENENKDLDTNKVLQKEENEIFSAISEHNYQKVINVLTKEPKSILSFNNDGKSAFFAMNKYPDMVELVAKNLHEVNPSLLKKAINLQNKNDSGFFLTHDIVSKNRKNLLELLIEYGLKIDVENNYGLTPSAMAGLKGNEECFDYLYLSNNINVTYKGYENVLSNAISTQNEYVIGKLFQNKNINQQLVGTFKNNKNIFHSVCSCENKYIINKFLSTKGLNISDLITSANDNNSTPIKMAEKEKKNMFIIMYMQTLDDKDKKDFLANNKIRSREIRNEFDHLKQTKTKKIKKPKATP